MVVVRFPVVTRFSVPTSLMEISEENTSGYTQGIASFSGTASRRPVTVSHSDGSPA